MAPDVMQSCANEISKSGNARTAASNSSHCAAHPHQMVCSSGDCQRRRRADYHRKKLKKDPLYRALCRDSQETWSEQNPEYMKRYRAGQREAKPDRPAVQPLISELKRLLTSVKNNLVEKHPGAPGNALCSQYLGTRPQEKGG